MIESPFDALKQDIRVEDNGCDRGAQVHTTEDVS